MLILLRESATDACLSCHFILPSYALYAIYLQPLYSVELSFAAICFSLLASGRTNERTVKSSSVTTSVRCFTANSFVTSYVDERVYTYSICLVLLSQICAKAI